MGGLIVFVLICWGIIRWVSQYNKRQNSGRAERSRTGAPDANAPKISPSFASKDLEQVFSTFFGANKDGVVPLQYDKPEPDVQEQQEGHLIYVPDKSGGGEFKAATIKSGTLLHQKKELEKEGVLFTGSISSLKPRLLKNSRLAEVKKPVTAEISTEKLMQAKHAHLDADAAFALGADSLSFTPQEMRRAVIMAEVLKRPRAGIAPRHR